jgi:cell division protein FtsQ
MWNNTRLLNAIALLLVSAVIAAVTAVALRWLTHRPQFVLRVVSVDAESGVLRHVTPATVRAVALPSIQGNFFSVNLEGVRQAFEAVAWVRHARVRREWPDRLVVRLEEHEALAIWNDDRLINTFGEVYSANLAEAEADGALPLLYGPEGSEKEVRGRYADMQNWFAALDLRPSELALSARYAWTVRLDHGSSNGLTVELGRETDANTLSERVTRLVAAYPEITARWPRLTFLDLRYPNGFALRAEGVPASAASDADRVQPALTTSKQAAASARTRLQPHSTPPA